MANAPPNGILCDDITRKRSTTEAQAASKSARSASQVGGLSNREVGVSIGGCSLGSGN